MDSDKENALKIIAHICYGMYVLSLAGNYILALIAFVVCYIKRKDVKGTYLESHYNWLVKTFVMGFILAITLLCNFMLYKLDYLWIAVILIIPTILLCAWVIARIAIGWLTLVEKKEIIESDTFPYLKKG